MYNVAAPKISCAPAYLFNDLLNFLQLKLSHLKESLQIEAIAVLHDHIDV
jgi:hypothetical protein